MTTANLAIQELLENSSGKKLKVKINDNRSTMLSVRWEPDYTRVSLHRIFLNAPQNVMDALACYIRHKDKSIHSSVRVFIEDSLKKLDYSHTLNRSKLYVQGNIYNLKHIYNELNSQYFDDRLELFITWFGKPNLRKSSRITFGLYYDPLKLIKINRILDSPSFPDYFVKYVVYHELLHYVCPSYYDEKGIHRIHSKEFKEKEKHFLHYQIAQEWIKENQAGLFIS
jgi:predicted SprT family Zn-dependent metalloprotease